MGATAKGGQQEVKQRKKGLEVKDEVENVMSNLKDEYAKISAESEARERVIDSWHQEATVWMDRFALTLSGSQELPRLLAKATVVADTYSAPEEIHGLLS